MKRVVLAYSGGLDTSVAIPWLSDQGWEVIAVAVDVGQPADLRPAVERASRLGAVDARMVDARDLFVQQFVLPSLRMNALYQGRYPLVSALSRPLISQVLVQAAHETGADAVAHGCTGKGNDQVRFEVSLSALAPDLEVLAPARDWGMGRDEIVAYARRRDLPIATDKSSPYSIDENLWGRSIECGPLEDAWAPPEEEAFALTASPEHVETRRRDVVIGFEAGAPVSVDGALVDPADAIGALGKIAGEQGFGRVDMVEDRLVGIKSREVYEAPAALSLIAAHYDLEMLTLERGLAREKRRLELLWAETVYNGLWFSPLREAMDAFASATQRSVTGEVRLRFSPGACTPVARRSPFSLYDRSLATYEKGDAFDHSHAAGFVRLWGLPTKQWSSVTREQG